jgi:hypothetical protein
VPTSAQQVLESEAQQRAVALAIADMRTAEGIFRAHMDKELREHAAAEARQRFRDAGITRRIENKVTPARSGETLVMDKAA